MQAHSTAVRARLEAELTCLDEVTLPRLVQTLAVTGGGTEQGRARRAALEADIRRVRGRAEVIRRALAGVSAAPCPRDGGTPNRPGPGIPRPRGRALVEA